MAYKTADLLKKSLEVIKSKRLIFIEEVVSFLPCTKGTFYEHKLNESDEIKAAIEQNKNEMKAGLRLKWYKSDNPTTQVALYKLIGTKEERLILSNSIDITSDGEGITVILQKREGSN